MNPQRAMFNIPRNIAYLNTAYFGCFTNKTTEEAIKGAKIKSNPWDITIPDFFKEADIARGLFAKLINTEPNNIALIPSASYGFALAAKNLTISKSDISKQHSTN